ncbi:HNH endonuclease [Pseudomonas syringae]|uniref:HNH endonuclease n=1 Tax=Pseudomonas syringae TaxID=317 RepID=UPI0020BEAF4C|nr:HNH endonuclease signature motif containing protein [Pseudomonas syringae]
MNPLPKPTVRELIYDVVKRAGHDVQPWGLKENGQPVKTPSANPFYCYRWAFVYEHSIILSIWWEGIEGDEIGAFYEANSRTEAMELERAVEDWRHTSKQRQQAGGWARSARQFDDAVKKAYREDLPIYGFLVARKDSEKRLGAFERSEASFRQLDTELWHVETYEMESGQYLIRRGAAPINTTGMVDTIAGPPHENSQSRSGQADAENGASLVGAPTSVDQFIGTERPEQYIRSGLVFERLAEVRRYVLNRAKGHCELLSCQAPGFTTLKGYTYLETHHATPLSDGGADSPANVIGLCPNHHREAHYGSSREAIYKEIMLSIAASETGLCP